MVNTVRVRSRMVGRFPKPRTPKQSWASKRAQMGDFRRISAKNGLREPFARTLGIDYLSPSRLAAMCTTTWVVQEAWNTSRTWISGLGGPRRSIFDANGRSRRDRQGVDSS